MYEYVKRNVWVSRKRPQRYPREDISVCACHPPDVELDEQVGLGGLDWEFGGLEEESTHSDPLTWIQMYCLLHCPCSRFLLVLDDGCMPPISRRKSLNERVAS